MTCGRPWAEQHERQDRALTGLATAVGERAAAQLGERVLDIGCGAGTTVLALAVQVGPNGYVLGADISEQSVARARERIATAGLRRVVVISADVVPSRMRRWLGPGEDARRGRCHRWQQVAHRFERCVWPRVFPRRAEHRERHPSPRLHRPAHILRRRRSDPRKTSHPGKNTRLKLPAAKAWVLPAERHGAVRAALERFFQSHATQQGVAFLLWQGAARGRFLPKGAYCENGSSDLNQAERLRLPSITCCKAVMPMR